MVCLYISLSSAAPFVLSYLPSIFMLCIFSYPPLSSSPPSIRQFFKRILNQAVPFQRIFNPVFFRFLIMFIKLLSSPTLPSTSLIHTFTMQLIFSNLLLIRISSLFTTFFLIANVSALYNATFQMKLFARLFLTSLFTCPKSSFC